MDKRVGISFVEVLVVIFILAMLVAVFFPFQMLENHEYARENSCHSNMRQIGMAMIMYTQDNDSRLPPRQAYDGHQRKVVSWRMLIEPYIRTTGIYKCPSNRAADWADIENDGALRSYAVNSSGGGKKDVGGPFSDRHPSMPIAKFKHPALTILVTESTAAFNDFNPLFPIAFSQPMREGYRTGHLFAGHSGYTNILFADGHVKALRPELTLSYDGGVNLWTIDGSAFSAQDLSTARSTLAYGMAQDKK